MPKMDGVETMKNMREMGYKHSIIALTANALIGQADRFLESGFDGYISKPIDTRELDVILNRFIRDKHLDDAVEHTERNEHDEHKSNKTNKVNYAPSAELLGIFCQEAKEAVTALREAIANDDIEMLSDTAHAMKTALAYMQESEASESAFALEQAGLEGDDGFISANIEDFIETLETVIKRLSSD